MSSLPEPLTPPDADLRKLPAMLLDVVRLRDSDLASDTSADVFRCAVLSWCASWHQVPSGSLPDDDTRLAYIMGFGRDVNSWRALRAQGGLRGWVKCSDGRLYHPVVAEKVIDAMASKKQFVTKLNAWRAAQSQKQAETRPQEVTENITNTHDNVREGKVREDKVIREEQSPTETGAPVVAPLDPLPIRDQLWAEGPAILAGLTGKSDGACRTFLGKLLKEAGDDCALVLSKLHVAKQDRPLDAPAWLRAAIKPRVHEGPRNFASLLRERAERDLLHPTQTVPPLRAIGGL